METIDETNAYEGESLHEAVRILTQEVTELRRIVTLQSATTHEVPPRVSDAPRGTSRARSPTNFDEQSDDRGSAINKKRHGIRADTLKIQKFDGTDYHLWEFSMVRYMKILGLWDYVNGDFPKPSLQEASQSEIIAWNEGNNDAEGVIMSSITKSQMQLLTSCESAHEMWLKLKETYQAESQANKMRLLEQYHSFSMKKGTTMEAYIRAMDSLVDKLRGVGELVSDHSKVLNLLKG